MGNRTVSGEKKKSLSHQTPEVSSVGSGTFLPPSDGGVLPAPQSPFEGCCSGAALPCAPGFGTRLVRGWRGGTRLAGSLRSGQAPAAACQDPKGSVAVRTKPHPRERVGE